MGDNVELVKVEAFIRPDKIDDVINELDKNEVKGISVSEAKGHGQQRRYSDIYRGGHRYMALIPKIHLTVITPHTREKEVVAIIGRAANTDTSGDGIVFTTPVNSFFRISNKTSNL